MANLKDYFEIDGSKTFCIRKDITAHLVDNVKFNFIGRLHLDFESNSLYVSFYIEKNDTLDCPAAVALSKFDEVVNYRNEVIMEGGTLGEKKMKSKDMKFTGRIFIYDENDEKQSCTDHIIRQSEKIGHTVQFRRNIYAQRRAEAESPLAFISHDSRDKDDIARPIVQGLTKLVCPVWFDEYSLNVGDSLRESIEKGIKEAKKCVLIITPNFIENSGWTKSEFNSVFTKDILLKSRSILPVWYGVTKEQVYEYSPTLLDTVALIWPSPTETDAERKRDNIVKKLRGAIMGNT